MKRITAIALAALVLALGLPALAVEGSELSIQMVQNSACLEQVSTRRCAFQCNFINKNPEKTVSGFDLAYVALDRNQNVSMEETTQLIELSIQPGDTRAAPTVYITNQNELAYLIIAVQTIYFSDGTSESIDFARGENYDSKVFRVI